MVVTPSGVAANQQCTRTVRVHNGRAVVDQTLSTYVLALISKTYFTKLLLANFLIIL